MGRGIVLVLLIFFIFDIPVIPIDMDEDTYGSVSDYLLEVYGIDENQGLTTLPVLDVPMGGRAEGMVGAFAAVVDDASFIEWNPAGSSILERTELAFFHNNWIGDTKVEGAVYTTRFNNLGLSAGAKWLYLPFTEYNEYGDRAAKGYYSEGVVTLNGSYKLLSGYYFSGLSLGINLKGAFRFSPDYSDDQGEVIAGSGASQSVFAPMVDLGLLTSFNILKFYNARERNTTVALVLRNIGFPALDEALPTKIVGALSYRPLRPILVSFDYTIPINVPDPKVSELPYWGIGTSVDITNFLAMRSGVLMKGANLRFAIGSAVHFKNISLDINYTLDLLTQLQPMNRISLGARFNLGDRGRKERAALVEDYYLKGLEAYAMGNNLEALQHWNAALALDPRFDPAREGKEAILGSQRLEERIDDIQRIE